MMGQPAFSTEKSHETIEVTNCFNEGNVIFLQGKNPVPNTEIKTASIPLENLDDYLADCKTMNATQLRKKYSLTYSSWKNMKQRCVKLGYILDPKFELFRDFLRLMGPRREKKITYDRRDFENPNYSPDNCRWANKHTQNRNKGNNVHLTHNGESHPVSVWASKTNQKADTLYKRIAKGWSDAEVITGKPKVSNSPAEKTVRMSGLKIEELDNYLRGQLTAMKGAQERLKSFYDLNGPESTPPKEVVAEHELAQNNYWTLLNEIKKRMPSYDVRVRFHELFQSD